MPSGRCSRVVHSARRSYQADLPAHLAEWFRTPPKNLRQEFSPVDFIKPFVDVPWSTKKLLIASRGSPPFLAEDAGASSSLVEA